jgi:formylglycine-generating enzyme required for sulfatase activity
MLLTACGKVVSEQPNPSCASDRAGADHACGVQNDADCCGAAAVPGGTYDRLNNAGAPATVSAFSLDTFEVTVGRFRAFVDAYPGSMPQPGDGANPHLLGSGWQAAWDSKLPPTRDALIAALQCPLASPSYLTWTNTPANNENTPVSCLTWYTAFAFCAWDAGRLPTLAEWDFAATGGDEQRPYPWGASPQDPTLAVLMFTQPNAFTPVGSVPLGAGRWGHLDLGGSRNEFFLDDVDSSSLSAGALPMPCVDCALLRADLEGTRMLGDASFVSPPAKVQSEETEVAFFFDTQAGESVGVRCARNAQ